MKPAKYENLTADPRGTIQNIFRYLNLSDEDIDLALEATKRDSQAGLSCSQQNSLKHGSWMRTKESVNRCNRVLQVFGLPELDSDYVIKDITKK